MRYKLWVNHISAEGAIMSGFNHSFVSRLVFPEGWGVETTMPAASGRQTDIIRYNGMPRTHRCEPRSGWLRHARVVFR